MYSPLRKQMKELCSAAEHVVHLLGWATVEDVAELRMQLNRVQGAIAGMTNEQVLAALLNVADPEEQAKGYLSTDLPAGINLYDPHSLVAEAEEVVREDGHVELEVTSLLRASDRQKGTRHSLDFATPINARLTAAAVPDLSKCSTMVIKS